MWLLAGPYLFHWCSESIGHGLLALDSESHTLCFNSGFPTVVPLGQILCPTGYYNYYIEYYKV